MRNTGGAPVTNVVVSDTTPAFTTYTTTGGAAALHRWWCGWHRRSNVTAPLRVAGTITWTIPTLAPGEVATVTFNVSHQQLINSILARFLRLACEV